MLFNQTSQKQQPEELPDLLTRKFTRDSVNPRERSSSLEQRTFVCPERSRSRSFQSFPKKVSREQHPVNLRQQQPPHTALSRQPNIPNHQTCTTDARRTAKYRPIDCNTNQLTCIISRTKQSVVTSMEIPSVGATAAAVSNSYKYQPMHCIHSQPTSILHAHPHNTPLQASYRIINLLDQVAASATASTHTREGSHQNEVKSLQKLPECLQSYPILKQLDFSVHHEYPIAKTMSFISEYNKNIDFSQQSQQLVFDEHHRKYFNEGSKALKSNHITGVVGNSRKELLPIITSKAIKVATAAAATSAQASGKSSGIFCLKNTRLAYENLRQNLNLTVNESLKHIVSQQFFIFLTSNYKLLKQVKKEFREANHKNENEIHGGESSFHQENDGDANSLSMDSSDSQSNHDANNNNNNNKSNPLAMKSPLKPLHSISMTYIEQFCSLKSMQSMTTMESLRQIPTIVEYRSSNVLDSSESDFKQQGNNNKKNNGENHRTSDYCSDEMEIECKVVAAAADELPSSRKPSQEQQQQHLDNNLEQKQIEQKVDQQQSDRKKRTNNFYNLPRYFMMLILSLLSPGNLECLGVPRSIAINIQRIVNRMREQGRKRHGAKSNFYNHAHYNCLFLQEIDSNFFTGGHFSSVNKGILDAPTHNRKIKAKSRKDVQMIEEVFEVKEWNTFTLTSVNAAKAIITEVIVTQLNEISNLPLTSFVTQHADTYPHEKSKINYIKRVLIGIQKLAAGESLNRF